MEVPRRVQAHAGAPVVQGQVGLGEGASRREPPPGSQNAIRIQVGDGLDDGGLVVVLEGGSGGPEVDTQGRRSDQDSGGQGMLQEAHGDATDSTRIVRMDAQAVARDLERFGIPCTVPPGVEALPGDAGDRSYLRVTLPGRSLILMLLVYGVTLGLTLLQQRGRQG